MSRYYDYGDLSGDDSPSYGSSQSEDESETMLVGGGCMGSSSGSRSALPPFRCVLHLDVDCFYGQCEHLDRGIPTDRPLAVGQKHIIVTANYAARAYGVKKLESREAAKVKCPHLLIVEGSDLVNYRRHSRAIYESFRKACLRENQNISVCKGSGMDEMFADLSVIDASQTQGDGHSMTPPYYVFQGQPTLLTEDQSGIQTFTTGRGHFAADRHDRVVQYTQERRLYARRRFHAAALSALRIRQSILQETGFTTTLGISDNPLAAKLASGLKKPHTVNVLYPWHVEPLVADMPLRKIPGIGHRTMAALRVCLKDNYSHILTADETHVWTCKDLLQIPRPVVVSCLAKIPSYEQSAAEQCDCILQLCQGVDDSRIEDDRGGISKTVSVESSYRRGTIDSRKSVLDAVEDLYLRLPKLVRDRALWSEAPDRAYPSTIRLTVRSMDPQLASTSSKRRPFVTHSRQVPYQGRVLLDDEEHAPRDLRQNVTPLLEAMIFNGTAGINVTRINIAVTDFSDLTPALEEGQATLSLKPSGAVNSNLPASLPVHTRDAAKVLKNGPTNKRSSSSSTSSRLAEGQRSFPTNVKNPRADEIDPAVLAELPAEIAAEVRREYRIVPTAKRKRIDQFFARKSASTG